MPFVHSLVKAEVNARTGWCAPIEVGEAAPHYVSFVVPVDERAGFFQEYRCETITGEKGLKTIESRDFLRRGPDSFVLRVGQVDLWFAVRTASREDRRLPYVGELGH